MDSRENYITNKDSKKSKPLICFPKQLCDHCKRQLSTTTAAMYYLPTEGVLLATGMGSTTPREDDERPGPELSGSASSLGH